MSKLAIFGGKPVVKEKLKPYRFFDKKDKKDVNKLLDEGVLSGFYGSANEKFFGGKYVREFEKTVIKNTGSKYCISVNSNASGLLAAFGAIGLSPGDEVIVPPWTMSASVVTPLFYGGVPVFVDIEDQTFGLDPLKIEKAITKRTKAIMVVHLFGHPALTKEIRKIAKKYSLFLIEDVAQAPLSFEGTKRCGLIGDIGVFSMNVHKHVQTGEGGFCLTDNSNLAMRLQMIRNHGENVIDWLKVKDLTNLVGLNLRLTEFQALLGINQFRKIESHVGYREDVSNYLTKQTKDLLGWQTPVIRKNCRHNYYMWTVKYDSTKYGVSRKVLCQALNAEGFPVSEGYVEPLYRLPVFKKKIAIGSKGFPFNLNSNNYNYNLSLPVVEKLHKDQAILFQTCSNQITKKILKQYVSAILKVFENIKSLTNLKC